jgi:hypothetical protein
MPHPSPPYRWQISRTPHESGTKHAPTLGVLPLRLIAAASPHLICCVRHRGIAKNNQIFKKSLLRFLRNGVILDTKNSGGEMGVL